MATLADIRTKVRRLTRSPSQAQITDNEINTYINTFILYDMPYNIQPFDLRRTLTFYTRPYIDTYGTNTEDLNDPLYNFKNRYINVFNPVYLDGYPIALYLDKQNFWMRYPTQNYIMALPQQGDGVTTVFAGTLTYKPILQGTLTFNSIGLVGLNNVAITLQDVPHVVNGYPQTTGYFVIPSELGVIGTINYVTGEYMFHFPVAPAVGQPIYAQYYPYMPSRPACMLYTDSTFIMRPIPDRSYPVTLDVTIRPTELLDDAQVPEIEQWWQYIAYGAAKKIFEDRLDIDSIQLIMPELKNQEVLCMRKKIIQNSKRRANTIYNQPSGFNTWGNFPDSGIF